MSNPDTPPRALPAAWRLLMAMHDGKPCTFSPAGYCLTLSHRFTGPGAVELRRELGVRCLYEVVPRVLEAESGGEVAAAQPVTEAAARLRAEPTSPTLAQLWQVIDGHTAQADLLRYALAKSITGHDYVSASSFRAEVAAQVRRALDDER